MKKRLPLTHLQRSVLALLEREMKAPLTNILALSQTLTAGRLSQVAVREYARMTTFEACRMMRLLEEMAVFLQDGATSDTHPPSSLQGRVRTASKRVPVQSTHRVSLTRRR